jgi:probable rRNA maturation factor
MTPTDPHGAAEVTGMSTMPLEPDSPDPLSSEQWQTDGGSHLDLVIDRHIWPDAVIDSVRPLLTTATDMTCQTFGWPRLEIGALFGGDERIHELNLQFRGKDAPTNVLSFPSADDDGMMDQDMPDRNMPDRNMPDQTMTDIKRLAPGEIAIAYETLSREAVRDGKDVKDHLVHLWVHGLLHLMGHDHQADDEAEIMEAGEIRILARLGIANPYAGSDDQPDGEAV